MVPGEPAGLAPLWVYPAFSWLMKILLVSFRFAPEVGGIQKNSGIIANALVRRGHEVVVVTGTRSDSGSVQPFEVCRAPGPLRLLRLHLWADVVLHNNISLRFAWPLLVARRPWIVTHHTWIAPSSGPVGIQGKLKQLALSRACCELAVSDALLRPGAARQQKIGNAFNDQVIRHDPGIARDKELIFVGRLVGDKGADVLIKALALLKQSATPANLTIVGDGPIRNELEVMAANLGVEESVRFLGIVEGPALASELSAHRILVVPSTWAEPFGIVATEAIACGCFVVGSNIGGIPEAIGPCGLTFTPGNPVELADTLRLALTDRDVIASSLANAEQHLSAYLSDNVALAYESVIEKCLKGPRPT
jgi:glycogen(starch) synthase